MGLAHLSPGVYAGVGEASKTSVSPVDGASRSWPIAPLGKPRERGWQIQMRMDLVCLAKPAMNGGPQEKAKGHEWPSNAVVKGGHGRILPLRCPPLRTLESMHQLWELARATGGLLSLNIHRKVPLRTSGFRFAKNVPAIG